MGLADGEDLPHARVVKETIAVHDPATGVTSHTTTTHKKLLTKADYEAIGRALINDLLIRNHDRFPVPKLFGKGNRGNTGNLMLGAEDGVVLTIDPLTTAFDAADETLQSAIGDALKVKYLDGVRDIVVEIALGFHNDPSMCALRDLWTRPCTHKAMPNLWALPRKATTELRRVLTKKAKNYKLDVEARRRKKKRKKKKKKKKKKKTKQKDGEEGGGEPEKNETRKEDLLCVPTSELCAALSAIGLATMDEEALIAQVEALDAAALAADEPPTIVFDERHHRRSGPPGKAVRLALLLSADGTELSALIGNVPLHTRLSLETMQNWGKQSDGMRAMITKRLSLISWQTVSMRERHPAADGRLRDVLTEMATPTSPGESELLLLPRAYEMEWRGWAESTLPTTIEEIVRWVDVERNPESENGVLTRAQLHERIDWTFIGAFNALEVGPLRKLVVTLSRLTALTHSPDPALFVHFPTDARAHRTASRWDLACSIS